MMGRLCFKTGEYLMMKRLPIKAIYLRRLESYSMETKMLRYKDFFPDETDYDIEARRVKHSAIKIDPRVEEHHLPALDEESKDSMQNELDDTNVKSLLDTIGVTRTKGIPDDKSSQSYSTRSEGLYKNFKNKISLTKKQSASILKKVKIGFLISLFFNAIVYSILFTVLQASVKEYSEGTDTVITLGNLRYDLLTAAYLTRKLYENDAGYQITESREEIITKLIKIRDNLKIYTNDLKHTDESQGPDQDIQFSTYLWWYYQQDKYTPGDLNIIDSSKRVNVLINNIINYPIISSQPDFLEIYRNAPFELNRNLNNTSISFINAYKGYVQDNLDLIMIIFNAVVNSKFFIKLVLILYIFTVLNNIRKKIFTSLMTGNKINLNIALVKIKDRLIFLHNEDSSTIDIDERNKSKSRLTYCQHRYQKIVYLLITIVVALMAFIIIFPNILTSPNLIKILDEEVSHLYLNSELKNLILYGYFSAREMGLPISANLSNQHFINPIAELDECLAEIDYTSKLAFESVHMSTNIEDIYIGTNDLSYSLNTGVFEYMLLLRDIPSNSDSNTLIAYLESHEAYMEKLIVLSKEVKDIIKDDSDSLLINELSRIFEIIMLMIAVQGIVLFTGFFPLLSKLQNVLNNEIEILLYLPREDNGLHSSKYDK